MRLFDGKFEVTKKRFFVQRLDRIGCFGSNESRKERKEGKERGKERKRIGVSGSWTNTGWARRIKRALPIYPSKGTINV